MQVIALDSFPSQMQEITLDNFPCKIQEIDSGNFPHKIQEIKLYRYYFFHNRQPNKITQI